MGNVPVLEPAEVVAVLLKLNLTRGWLGPQGQRRSESQAAAGMAMKRGTSRAREPQAGSG